MIGQTIRKTECSMNNKLIKITEPTLLFGHGQAIEDPRDGLTLFGPYEQTAGTSIRYGLIGTSEAISSFAAFVKTIQRPVSPPNQSHLRPPFPGFDAAFASTLADRPSITFQVPEQILLEAIHLSDRHQRVFRAVSLYAQAIIKATREEEEKVDLWFVVIPDDVYRYCRPQSQIEKELVTKVETWLNPKKAAYLRVNPSMFSEDNEEAIPYQYAAHFHNQLKAQLLSCNLPIQILRQSTISWLSVGAEMLARRMDCRSTIAWNIATAVFYKTVGRPWKLSNVRKGVCYIGLVFKQIEGRADQRTACCAAQMFLDSGDGMVFKGAVGPWFNQERGDFHLTRRAAKQLVGIAVDTYKAKIGHPPAELFLHGRVRFDDEEWRGFIDAIASSTRLVGIRIRSTNDLKLYRKGTHPILRGLAYIRDERTAYLWSRGFIPRLRTYPGMEVPNPLLVDICRGQADIEVVLRDIMGLTKLNYNSCIFSDGIPVTLRFANSVGEILTAGPMKEDAPLPFRFYI